MRKSNQRQRSLAILLVTLLLCMNFVLQFSISSAQADEGNLADKAVAFIETQYQSQGAQNDPSTHYPYVAYVLKSAGLDLSGWTYDNLTLTDANCNLVDDDIANSTVAVKHLAQDLISMQAWGNNSRVSQIQTILHNRQQADGSFQDDNNAYSIIPAYELLGRAGQLSVVDTVYAQDYILGQQDTTSGAWPDFMTTAQAIRALNYLSPNAASDSAVGQAITNGCNWLKQQQQTNGSFTPSAWDDPLIDTSEAIATQLVLGLDPAVDWTNNGKSAVDYLNNEAVNGDGSLGSSQNLMDATWALDSCNLLGILPSGNITVTADNTVVTILDAPISINVASGVNNTTINVAALMSISGGTAVTQALPAVNINSSVQFSNQNPVVIQIQVPSGTSISAASNWDGTIQTPSIIDPATLPATALPASLIPDSANIISVGFGDVQLNFSQPVKIVLPGQHGKKIGYIRNNTFTLINTVLNSNSAAALIAAGTQDAYYDDGIDITIWTRHFTDFISYTINANGSDSGNLYCTPGIAVVGMNSELLYGPSNVTVSASNTWGLTALGALDATGLGYVMSPKWPGFVESIAGQANSGNQGWMYTVNDITPTVLAKDYTVFGSDQVIWYYSKSMSQPAPTWEQLRLGTYLNLIIPAAVTSNDGKAAVNPAAGGTVGLNGEASVNIPANALLGTSEVDVVVQKLNNSPAAPSGFSLLGSVFEFTVGGSTAYKFNQPVTLSFTFDLKSLPAGQTPSIYYYDEKSSQWVNLGGTVSGNTISVKVDHFTRYALFAKELTAAAPVIEVIEKSFMDVPDTFWAGNIIKDLYSRGYINGYPDGSFHPDKHISRAEFIAIINKILGLSSHKPSPANFTDVSSSDWYYESVENAVNAGMVKGYGTVFLPDQEISREELATILVNALGKKDQAQMNMQEKSSFTDDAGISNWARGYVITAARQGLINGYPDRSFNPQGKATRAEACSMIINFLNLNNSKP